MTYDEYLVSDPYITGGKDRRCVCCGKRMSRFEAGNVNGDKCEECCEAEEDKKRIEEVENLNHDNQ